MPFLTTALGIGAIVSGVAGAGASIAGASAQAGAAKSAAQLQYEEQQSSLAEQRREFGIQQGNEAPFLEAGQASARQLEADLAPGGSLTKQWDQPFVAPTAATEQNDPGYQFRLQQGQQALENSAAARGGVLSTGTAKDLTKFGQDYASNEYSNVYARAVQQYQQAYNIFQQGQANTFNRLSATAGGGQVAAGQLGQEGQAAASNIGNINMTAGAQIGQSYNNAAAATASGYAGAANAFGGGVSNLTGLLTLQQLLQKGQQPDAGWGGSVG